MAAARIKMDPIQTPRGTFKWPKLTEPDYGTKEYPNEFGSYNLKLVLDKKDADVLIAKIQPFYDAALVEAKEAFAALKIDTRKKLEAKNGKGGLQINPLFSVVYDKDTEEETGEIEFGFKMKASGVKIDGKKWDRKPPLFDAKGQPFPKGVDIWGGTVGIVAFKPNPYFVAGTGMAGCSLSLEAAQIIELVSAGSRTAEQFGFGEVEGGLDGSTLTPATPASEAMGAADAPADPVDADGGDF